MPLQDSFLEKVWGDLLSRDVDKIAKRYASLDTESQATVLDHLRRMLSEEGWHDEQVKSARAAMDVLSDKGR